VDNFIEFRDQMVEAQLAARDIHDKQVLAAFRKVPRHLFVGRSWQQKAYKDHPLPIECGQTISQPYMVALMTQCLELKGKERILEVGTGSGYQAAILAELAGEVYTIERHAQLAQRARENLIKAGYKNIQLKVGDGTLGWEEHAPYDGIIVTAGAPAVPQALKEQLADGGRLVIPAGNAFSQILVVLEHKGGEFIKKDLCGCVFVPLVGKEGWSEK